MTMTKRTNTLKALQKHLNHLKKDSDMALLEYEISCQTNSNRGHVYDQTELQVMFDRTSCDSRFVSCGASKCTYLGYKGIEFKNIVIKRSSYNAWIGRGNQLIAEIKTWLHYQDTEESDLLAPILKYFTSKSDKVRDTSNKMLDNVIIIAQKAIYISDAYDACIEAERLNNENGLNGENHESRYKKLEKLSEKNKWYDTLYNGGNSGVIFDYYHDCYKAVFIDYAL